MLELVRIRLKNGELDRAHFLVDLLLRRIEPISHFFPPNLITQLKDLRKDLVIRLKPQLSPQLSQRGTTRGRPYIGLTSDILEMLFESGCTYKDIISLSGITKDGLKKKLRAMKLKRKNIAYTSISEVELENHVKKFAKLHPNAGYRRLLGYLRKNGIRITYKQACDALRRVDPLASSLRLFNSNYLRRRVYKVNGPNALWHLDGNHRLARYNVNFYVFSPYIK